MKFLYLRLVMLILADNILTASGGVPSVFGALFLRNNHNKQFEENSVDDSQNEFSATENKITALRIEFIKNQILKKLRLKERPVISVGDLPKPLKDEDDIFPGEDEEFSNINEYYGKTQRVVVFPYEDNFQCHKNVHNHSVCLPFQMPDDLVPSDVSKAELWLHKNNAIFDRNESVVISEAFLAEEEKQFRQTSPVIKETVLTGSWTKVDVSSLAKKWIQFEEPKIYEIDVVCKTCSGNEFQSPISMADSYKPFLVIHTHSQEKGAVIHRRRKRSTNCDLGLNECCRESLYISFADIGWDDWIIKPEGYNAYFCKGSCMTPSAITLSASDHNSILQKLMYNKRRGSHPEFTSCCAARQYQPLQLVYMYGNKTLTTKLLSNMIVESCGCL